LIPHSTRYEQDAYSYASTIYERDAYSYASTRYEQDAYSYASTIYEQDAYSYASTRFERRQSQIPAKSVGTALNVPVHFEGKNVAVHFSKLPSRRVHFEGKNVAVHFSKLLTLIVDIV
jgi:hypothetical protein